MFARSLVVCLVTLLALGAPVNAQYGGDGGGYGADGGAAAGVSSRTTKQVVRTLKRGVQGCQSLPKVYRYDCYRETYKLAADQLAGRGAYLKAYEVLVDVERELDRVITRNADPTAPP